MTTTPKQTLRQWLVKPTKPLKTANDAFSGFMLIGYIAGLATGIVAIGMLLLPDGGILLGAGIGVIALGGILGTLCAWQISSWRNDGYGDVLRDHHRRLYPELYGDAPAPLPFEPSGARPIDEMIDEIA